MVDGFVNVLCFSCVRGFHHDVERRLCVVVSHQVVDRSDNVRLQESFPCPLTQIERFDHLCVLSLQPSFQPIPANWHSICSSYCVKLGEQVGNSNSVSIRGGLGVRAAVARLGLHFLPEGFAQSVDVVLYHTDVVFRHAYVVLHHVDVVFHYRDVALHHVDVVFYHRDVRFYIIQPPIRCVGVFNKRGSALLQRGETLRNFKQFRRQQFAPHSRAKVRIFPHESQQVVSGVDSCQVFPSF